MVCTSDLCPTIRFSSLLLHFLICLGASASCKIWKNIHRGTVRDIRARASSTWVGTNSCKQIQNWCLPPEPFSFLHSSSWNISEFTAICCRRRVAYVNICEFSKGPVYCPRLLNWTESQHDLWPSAEPINSSLLWAIQQVGSNNKPNASFTAGFGLEKSSFLWPLPAPSFLEVSCSDERRTENQVSRVLSIADILASRLRAKLRDCTLLCCVVSYLCASLLVWLPPAWHSRQWACACRSIHYF